MKKLLILGALALGVWFILRRHTLANGARTASIADGLGLTGASDLFDLLSGLAGNGIGGVLPFLGFSPQGPFGSGAFTSVRNYRYDQQRFISPYDANNGAIGGWGGGIGNQYDPSGWDGYSVWLRNLIPIGNGLTAADFPTPLPSVN